MVITATGADALHMPYVQSEYALDAEMNEILRAGVRGVKKNDVKLVTMKMNSAGGQDILMEE